MERPGLNVNRLARIVDRVVRELDLNLRGLDVLTEAATGAFAVTAAMAAAAGADEVVALAIDSQFGSAEEAFADTGKLAEELGVARALRFITKKSKEVVQRADIITNCRHLRPLDSETVQWMANGAVVPLMYEGWEHRPGDVDRVACEARDIPLVGTNERDPRVGVFDYLGPAAVRLLQDGGFEVLRNRILLVCHNPFQQYLSQHLSLCGATVEIVASLAKALPEGPFDAVLVAANPRQGDVVDPKGARKLAAAYPGTCVVQFWGDLNREALALEGLNVWPVDSPGVGRMGILLSDLGPEPAVRLQAGGLKVGELMARVRLANSSPRGCADAVRAALNSGYGSPLSGQEDPLR
jgi:hypothetical protein